MANIRIIVKTNKGGIYTDAIIFDQTINKKYPGESYIVTHDTVDLIEKKKEVLINIYIEHCKYSELTNETEYPSKLNLYMVNPELISDWDFEYLPWIDIVLCKTKYTVQVMEDLKERYDLPFQIEYINFTSPCKKLSDVSKDKNLVIHFAGGSGFLKNTKSLLKVWIENNGFVDTQPNVMLLISRWKLLKNEEDIDYWNSFNPTPINTFYEKKLNNATQYKNIVLTEKLDEDTRNYFMSIATYAICPSLIEGFGHYINESRCYHNYVITVDAPPMNELITSKSGTLVPFFQTTPSYKLFPKNKYIFKDVLTTAYYVNPDKLAKSIIDVLKMKQDKIDKKIKRAYEDFSKDTEEFNNKLIKIIGKLLKN